MKYIITNQHGVVVSTGEAPDTLPPAAFSHLVGEGQTLHFASAMLGDRFVAGEVTPRPVKPSEYHAFDDVAFAWVLPPNYTEILAREARAKRDRMLAASDWTQLPDVPLVAKDAWATYRQALRDITEQPGFPTDVVWPEAQF